MIGFIGNGNMGRAILGGILSNGITTARNVIISDVNSDGLNLTNSTYGVRTTEHNREAANSDILFLAVKPNVVYTVIDEIKDVVSDNTLIISIVAGQSIEKLTAAFGKSVKLIRVMPNTPALVGEGMAALSTNANVTDEECETALKIFNSFGRAEIVPEYMMDAVTAVSGSSPAYVFMLIEAMADAAVIGGMPRSQAYTFAAQSVLGSAKMVLDTGKHPGALKDMVCSPAGTTIDAVGVLEAEGFRGAVIKAMEACMEKSKKLG